MKVETRNHLILMGSIYKDGVGMMIVHKHQNKKPVILKLKTKKG